ncbi:hypothetical protein C8F04DRAFT_1263738 [Mycena alexandri]|uniref:DUF6534 domain-containing protein n=1 Tax=Mycena alexandri TaxID=1745969 RepID=A0AAD6SMJ5_9AGAR|nr:hypothetical protein C8F04DRAFT_1263738 [Mycena alexandri]
MENSEIKNTSGPLVLGSCFQCFLAGMAIIQAARYYTRETRLTYRNAADIFNHIVYQTATLHFGNVAYGGQGTWATWVEPAITAAVGAIAHVFFLYRCWLATSKSRTICAFMVLFLAMSLGSGIAVAAFLFHAKSLSRISTIPVPMGLWLSAAAVTDTVIAIILIVEHLKNPRDSGVAKKIIQLTFETGAVTAVVAVLNLILYFAIRSTTYHLLAELSLPGIYALSVLTALLNHEAAGPRLNSFVLGGTMTGRVEKKVEVKVDRIVERNVLVWSNVHAV